ncbi:hypothetical protein H6G27_02795 [Nostoc linckia FACHB-104]|nr:hypothetical protein [Nostoc linckia FACHB-104]
MGNGEWVMGNGEWVMGNGERGTGNGEWVMGTAKLFSSQPSTVNRQQTTAKSRSLAYTISFTMFIIQLHGLQLSALR